MSYLNKCVVKTDFYLRTLKPTSNLIIFIVSNDIYIPVSRNDLSKIISLKQEHYIEDTNKLESFYKIPNEIHVDSSLEKCFKNKNNTMKLELKDKFRIDSNKNKRLFSYYSVTPLKRKEIESDTKESSYFEKIENEINSDSEDENNIDWNLIIQESKARQMFRNEQKRIDNSETKDERQSFSEAVVNECKCHKEYRNSVLYEEMWYNNRGFHRDGDLSARIFYYENGNKKSESWYKNGKMIRDNDLPVHTEFYENGNKKYEGWRNDDDRRVSRDLPDRIDYYENGNKKKENWTKNYTDYRESGLPTTILYYKNGNKQEEQWFKNHGHYREGDLPSVIKYYENGVKNSEEWKKSFSFYKRENNLPNFILYNPKGNKKEEIWYDETGNFHCKEGPSYIEYCENGNKKREMWYENGNRIQEIEYVNRNNGNCTIM